MTRGGIYPAVRDGRLQTAAVGCDGIGPEGLWNIKDAISSKEPSTEKQAQVQLISPGSGRGQEAPTGNTSPGHTPSQQWAETVRAASSVAWPNRTHWVNPQKGQSMAAARSKKEGTLKDMLVKSLREALFASLKDDLQTVRKDLSQDLKAVCKDLTELSDRVLTTEDQEDEEIEQLQQEDTCLTAQQIDLQALWGRPGKQI
ncbi:hypothetical protein NDU88_010064 [Pleurodeles waltl]|uniref:Uncharacterized protein n=1 Tax=Pleurodeles waltl TaxID=8319 RepID=A0AAV7QTB2_PLEWA|nr:hypothetical protein NDU88_010064 [Pleurodeles waltl]